MDILNSYQLVDSFSRKHDYLRISLTERCNLRCTYCMPAEGIKLRPREEFMRTEEVISIAETFVKLGINKIRLTGGEPLVRKDVCDVIKGLSQLPVELTLTTNAILLDEYLYDIKQAGVKSINISLDTLRQDRMVAITRRDYYQRTLENIELAIKSGLEIKINAVLMKGVNDDEFIDFVKWTNAAPIHVRFIEFMPFNGNGWDWTHVVSQQALMDRLDQTVGQSHYLRIMDGPNSTSRNYQLAGAKGTFGFISTVTNPFCDTCNRIRLTADGKIKNCLFSNSETDLLSAHREGMDIVPLIIDSISKKKKMRAGMDSMEQFSEPSLNTDNRAMIAIGG